jgi:hypothetical protein
MLEAEIGRVARGANPISALSTLPGVIWSSGAKRLPPRS